jgi:NADH-quinone oxidoreductase subunit J
MNFETIFFFFIAFLAVVSAVLMITRRNPIASVLYLIVNFFCLAVLYLLLRAQFIAIIQILVYAGAIMVLFLFVIMLLNLGNEKAFAEKKSFRKYAAVALVGTMLFEIVLGILLPIQNGPASLHPQAAQIGTVEFIGRVLFSDYLLPFEVTSILLLAALVGVIVLAKKKFQ